MANGQLLKPGGRTASSKFRQKKKKIYKQLFHFFNFEINPIAVMVAKQWYKQKS